MYHSVQYTISGLVSQPEIGVQARGVTTEPACTSSGIADVSGSLIHHASHCSYMLSVVGVSGHHTTESIRVVSE